MLKKRSKEIIDLAIITPTLNEEHFIGCLLDSIINQDVQPKEIVVVDAYSTDKTMLRIKSRQKQLPQLKIFQITKSTIARQRNFGVKQTIAKHLLFLDADANLREADALKRYFAQIKEGNFDLAIATNYSTTNYWKDKVFFKAIDLAFKIFKPIWPMATSINMYILRDTFKKNGGFDENIAVGEDFEIVYRIVKNKGKFSILDDPKVYTSPRRLEKTGRINFALKSIQSFIRIVRYGFRNNPIDYEFGKFTNTRK